MSKQKCPFCKSLIDHLYYINLKTDLTIGRFFSSKSNVAIDVVENTGTEKYQCPLCHGIIALNIVDADKFMKTGKIPESSGVVHACIKPSNRILNW